MDLNWLNALSPIAVVVLGVWIKRSQEARAANVIDAAAKAKVAAAGAEALARENLARAVELVEGSKRIEKKVDGRLTKAVDDLAAANEAITKMSVDNAAFQGRLLRLLDNPSDIAGAKRAIVAEGQTDVMSVDFTKGPNP